MNQISAELTNIPLEEWQALEAFFGSTNGAHWHLKGSRTNSTPWVFANYPKNNPCYDRWFGVTCTCYHHSQMHYYGPGTYVDYYYDEDSTNVLATSCNVEKLVLANYNLTLRRSKIYGT